MTQAQVSGYADLAHDDNENVILIYFIQTNDNNPNSPGELHYSFQKLKVGQSPSSLNMDLSTFKVISSSKARVSSN